MSVNRIQIKASLSDKKVTIPLGQIFDELGREQLLEMHDEIELQNNINYIQVWITYIHVPCWGILLSLRAVDCGGCMFAKLKGMHPPQPGAYPGFKYNNIHIHSINNIYTHIFISRDITYRLKLNAFYDVERIIWHGYFLLLFY